MHGDKCEWKNDNDKLKLPAAFSIKNRFYFLKNKINIFYLLVLKIKKSILIYFETQNNKKHTEYSTDHTAKQAVYV